MDRLFIDKRHRLYSVKCSDMALSYNFIFFSFILVHSLYPLFFYLFQELIKEGALMKLSRKEMQPRTFYLVRKCHTNTISYLTLAS